MWEESSRPRQDAARIRRMLNIRRVLANEVKCVRAPSVNITYVDYVGPKMAKTNILSVPLSEVDFLDHSFMALSIIVCTFQVLTV